MGLWISGDSHGTAIAEDFIPFRNGLLSIVRALGVNCGPQHIQHALDVRFVEKHDVVHTTECRNKLHSFIQREDRPAGILDQPHRLVAIDRNNEDVTQRLRVLQIPEMSDVENVEAAICKDHLLAPYNLPHFFERPKFHRASPSTASTNSR